MDSKKPEDEIVRDILTTLDDKHQNKRKLMNPINLSNPAKMKERLNSLSKPRICPKSLQSSQIWQEITSKSERNQNRDAEMSSFLILPVVSSADSPVLQNKIWSYPYNVPNLLDCMIEI